MNIFILIGIVWFFIAIILAVTAEANDRSGFFWFGITLVFGIFALLAYVVSSPSEKERELEERVSELEQAGNYCQTCGSELEGGTCPECDTVVETTEQPKGDETASESTGTPFMTTLEYGIFVFPAAIGSAFLWMSLLPEIFTVNPYGPNRYAYSGITVMGVLMIVCVTLWIMYVGRSSTEKTDVTSVEKWSVASVLSVITLVSVYSLFTAQTHSLFQFRIATLFTIVTVATPASLVLIDKVY